MDEFSNWLTLLVAAEVLVLLLILAFMALRFHRTKNTRRRSYLLKALQWENDDLQSLQAEAEALQTAIKMKVGRSTCPDPSRMQGLQCEIYRSRAELARLREWLNEATVNETRIIAANVKLLRHKNGKLSYELLNLMEEIFGRQENLDDQQSGPLKLLAAG